MPPNLVIGLTGGIGSGKSAAAERFALLGIDVIDADQVAREVVAIGEPALARIAERFGEAILRDGGELDRARLRAIIFAQPQEKAWLESLLHPIIRQRLIWRLQGAESPYCILVSPLLLETDQHRLVDRVLVIDSEEAAQIGRATQRDDADEKEIRAIMATQIKRADRLARADDIVHNHGRLDELDDQIAELHRYYLTLAET